MVVVTVCAVAMVELASVVTVVWVVMIVVGMVVTVAGVINTAVLEQSLLK